MFRKVFYGILLMHWLLGLIAFVTTQSKNIKMADFLEESYLAALGVMSSFPIYIVLLVFFISALKNTLKREITIRRGAALIAGIFASFVVTLISSIFMFSFT